MLWPYVVFTFITLVLFRLGLHIAAVAALLASLLYFLSDFRRMPRRWIFICLAGVIAGALLYYIRLPLLSPQAAPAESGNATVTGISRKSVIVTTDNGGKLRLTGFKKENLPQKYARVSYACTQQTMPDSTFSVFEKLSGVHAWCRVTKLQVLGTAGGRLARYRAATLDFLYAKFNRVSPDEHSLIAAFLLGDTDELSADELDAFRDMGLMHLFAVSGLNIALLFGLIYLPFRTAGLPALGSALGYAVATGFLLLLDFPVPLLRAWLFMTLGLGMRLLDRRITSGALLFLTAVIVELLRAMRQPWPWRRSSNRPLRVATQARSSIAHPPERACITCTRLCGNKGSARCTRSSQRRPSMNTTTFTRTWPWSSTM